MKLKKDISQTINRLRGRVEGRLGEPVRIGPVERLLFDHAAEGEDDVVLPPVAPSPAPRFPEPVLRVYAKDFADHALQHLPQAAKYKSVEAFRKYLAEKLRFNSEATRRRSANYIVSRFFPGDVYYADVPAFAAATACTSSSGTSGRAGPSLPRPSRSASARPSLARSATSSLIPSGRS